MARGRAARPATASSGIAADGDRARAWRRATRSSSARARPATCATPSSSRTTPRRYGVERSRRHDARRLPDRSRARRLRARRPRGRVRRRGCCPSRRPRRRRPRSSARAETPRRLAAPMLERAARARPRPTSTGRSSCRSRRCSRRWRTTGVKIDTYRMGEITARLADRVEELESQRVRARGRGVRARLAAAARPHPVREARADRRAARARPATRRTRKRAARDPRRPRDRAGDRGVARADEAAQHVPRPAAVADLGDDGRLHTHFNQTVAATGRLSTSIRTCSRSRSAPSSAARSARRSSPSEGRRLLSADYSQIELRILAHVSGEPKLREAFERGEDIHTATAAEVLGVEPAKLTSARALDREDDQLRDRLRHLGVRALREPRDPARGGAAVHRRVPRALPARAGLHRPDDRAGDAGRLRRPPCSAGAGRCPSSARRTGRRAASASGSPSTS